MSNLNDSDNNQLRQNPFTRVFDSFSTEGTQERLDKKFEHKPYYIEYKLLRITALLTSYLFNGFSALTAAALIFFFVRSLAGTIAAAIVTAGAIVALEMGKRFVNAAFFKNLLQYSRFSGGLLAVLILLTGLSVASSYFGGKKTVAEFSGEAKTISTDSTTAQVDEQLAAIDKQIETLSSQKNSEGIIYWNAQNSIGELTKQRAALVDELARTREKTDNDNDATATEHEQTTALKGEHFALVTLLCELLFLLCSWYLEYYDWRSFVELRAKAKEEAEAQQADPNNPVSNTANSPVSNPQLNGHSVPAGGGGYSLQNRVVVTGFQPHSTNTPNSPVNNNPVITDQPFVSNCQHCHNDFETFDRSVITCDNCLASAANEAANQLPITNSPVSANGLDPKHCDHCGKLYQPKTWNQRFCSNKGDGNCKDAYHAARHDGRPFNPALHHNQKA